MDAGINNVIYMELYSGPKMANGRCGKTIDTGTIDRGSTVYLTPYLYIYLIFLLIFNTTWMSHLQAEQHVQHHCFKRHFIICQWTSYKIQ